MQLYLFAPFVCTQSRPIFPAAGYLEITAEAVRSAHMGSTAHPLMIANTVISQPLLMGSSSSPEGMLNGRNVEELSMLCFSTLFFKMPLLRFSYVIRNTTDLSHLCLH